MVILFIITIILLIVIYVVYEVLNKKINEKIMKFEADKKKLETKFEYLNMRLDEQPNHVDIELNSNGIVKNAEHIDSIIIRLSKLYSRIEELEAQNAEKS